MRKDKNKWIRFCRKTGVLLLTTAFIGSLSTGCGSSGTKNESSSSKEAGSEANSDADSKDDASSDAASGDSSEENSSEEEVLGIPDAASYVKKLADYKHVVIQKSKVKKELEKKISELLKNESYKSGEQIKTGKVKKGDTMNIYYVGKIDGKAFDGGSCTKETNPEGYDLTIGSGQFIPGFEDSLIGKEIGKTVDITVTFPEEYGNEELNGKDAVFTVTLNYKVGEKKVFDDAFVAKNLSSQYSSVKDYKEKNTEDIIKSLAIKKVLDETELKDYPQDLYERTKTQFVTPIEKYNETQGSTMDDFISQNYKSKEEYEKDLKKNVTVQLESQIIYNAILQKEKIEIKDSEVEEQVKNYIASYGVDDEAALNKRFKENYGGTARSLIYSNLVYQKAVDLIVKNVVQK